MWNNMSFGDGGYGLMHGGGYWLGMGLHGLFWIGLLVLVVVMVAWVARSATRPGLEGAGANGPSAREILDERFARGEIEKDEYLARKETLGR